MMPFPDPEIATVNEITDYERFHTWLREGVEAGWISEPYCDTHDGGPLREWEEKELDEGADPCLVAVRIWLDGHDDES